MIKVTATTDFKPINDLSQFVGDFQSASKRATSTAFSYANQNLLLTLVQTTPPPAKKPIEWTSDKQRRFVMAKLRREDNLPYKRTGRANASWRVELKQEGNTSRIVVQNTWDASQFVYGTLNMKSRNAALAVQQKFHRNTGWPLAVDIVKPGLLEIKDIYLDELSRLIGLEFGDPSFKLRSQTKF